MEKWKTLYLTKEKEKERRGVGGKGKEDWRQARRNEKYETKRAQRGVKHRWGESKLRERDMEFKESKTKKI